MADVRNRSRQPALKIWLLALIVLPAASAQPAELRALINLNAGVRYQTISDCLVLATFLHLRAKYGLTPGPWDVILEPDNTQARTGTRIGQAIGASAAVLKAYGFIPRFVAPSTANMTRH